MSWSVQQAVFHSDLPGIIKNRMQAKLVLLALAHFTDDAGANAWPAVATIAKLASCSVRTVQGLTKTLVGARLLEQQAPACRHRPTIYRVNLARLGAQIAAPLATDSGVQTPAVLNHQEVQLSAPLDGGGVQTSVSRGAEQALLGVQLSADDLTYGNLKKNNLRLNAEKPDKRPQAEGHDDTRAVDAQTVAEHAYQQLTPSCLAHLERDARVELGGLLSLQPPEKVPTMIRKQVHLYLRDPRVRQEFLGVPAGKRSESSAA